ncbi:hypothetical protein MKW98_009849 [Papaver atlanticum]|uniref:Uncharacterized protein n=1 Tax=Papaver atlanticum TaxID=357466 RepID=A0AAD4TA24_9MAGN|nr:hypothetical protein MKW98_009849 [Papaver atlanticum]
MHVQVYYLSFCRIHQVNNLRYFDLDTIDAHERTSTLSAIHIRNLDLLMIIMYLDLGSHYLCVMYITPHTIIHRLGSIGRACGILPRGCGFDSDGQKPT